MNWFELCTCAQTLCLVFFEKWPFCHGDHDRSTNPTVLGSKFSVRGSLCLPCFELPAWLFIAMSKAPSEISSEWQRVDLDEAGDLIPFLPVNVCLLNAS